MHWTSLLALVLAASSDAFLVPSASFVRLHNVGTQSKQVCFAEIETSAEDSVSVEDASSGSAGEEPKRVVNRERHTLFVGNLPFGE